MKPRVLIFSIAYEPLLGGAELAVRNITDRLFDHDFDLITARFSRRHETFERIGNVNVYRVGFGSRLGRYLFPVFAYRLAARLHKTRPYQVVWAIMAAYAGAAALMFLRRFPAVKFLLTLQEGDPIRHIHKQVRGFRKPWQRIFKRADYIQAISQHLADWARTEGAACPVEVVPNGVSSLSFSPSQREGGDPPAGRAGERGGKKIIITTSRLVPKNGIDVLIRAMAVILTRRRRGRILRDSSSQAPQNDTVLQIVGSGLEEDKLKKLAKDLGVEDAVEFIGEVNPDEIPKYLSQADIFVRPSRSEGLGTAFLEAMAAGLPVIGTQVGGIVDFLISYWVSPPSAPPKARSGEGEMKRGFANGLFVKPEDPKDLAEKILLLLKNEELRERLGRNGRRLVEEKYNWDKVAERMSAIFNKLPI